MIDDASLLPADEQLLTRLSEWLAQTRAEAAAWHHSRPGRGDEQLGDEQLGDEQLGDELLNDEPVVVTATALDPDFETIGPGLFQLVEEFTALRQDVKLQAKSARGLQDQVEGLLAGLHRSIEQFQSVPAREQEAVRDALRPVLESLVDLDVAFDRGRLAAEAARARLLEDNTWTELIAAEFAALSLWRRWGTGALRESLTRVVQQRAAQSWTATVDAQVDGYRLIQNRLRRVLAQLDVERLSTIGGPTDPNCMTVVDVADDPRFPPGTVLDELRPGYHWQGQILRYAEVRAVRSPGPTGAEDKAWTDDDAAESAEDT